MRKVLALLAFSLVTLAGCGGGGTTTIEGTVTKGGAPYTPPEGEKISITIEGGGTSIGGEVNSEGKFKIEKVKTGKYSVTVTTYKAANGPTKGAPTPMRVRENWDVSSSSKTFTIDLAQLIK